MNDEKSILIIDDEEEFLRSASFALRSADLGPVETLSDPSEAMARLTGKDYAAVLLDIMMPVVSGRDLLPRITAENPGLPVVMVTAVNEVETAVACIRDGAYDYLLKPVDKARLLTTIRKALEFSALRRENGRLTESLLSPGIGPSAHFSAIVTENEAMLALFRYLDAVAATPYPILIQGETGTGKELFAAALHTASGRRGAFVPVNSAGLDDALFTDTLFGHEKGAFTGAERKRDGLVAKAAGGTLFLDEIGDLRPESQVRLLRLLENGTYFPVGSDTEKKAEVRVVAATNLGLEKAVAGGRFRKDLYFRLRGHSVAIPPLRERPDDLRVLTRHFLKAAAAELGKPAPTPPSQLFTLLASYAFPGNVRELKTMVADAVSRHPGGVLSLASFQQAMDRSAMLDSAMPLAEPLSAPAQAAIAFGPALPSLRDAEEALVAEALKRCGGNQTQAARILGITPSAINKRVNKSSL